jgi:CxxC motif-containing protein (DUF1111 family)
LDVHTALSTNVEFAFVSLVTPASRRGVYRRGSCMLADRRSPCAALHVPRQPNGKGEFMRASRSVIVVLLASVGAQSPLFAHTSASDGTTPAYTPLYTTTHSAAESVNWHVEPDGTLVTVGSGRARSRHESEDIFYTFPVRYFEQRSFGFEIHDHIPAGGHTIDIYYTPQYAYWRAPECRNAYRNPYRAAFNNNIQFDSTPVTPAGPDGTGQQWVCHLTRNAHSGSDGVLRVGDWMEVEFQEFIGVTQDDPNVIGQNVYYTDTYRFRVGHPGLYVEEDDAVNARISAGGNATAPFVRAGESVQPAQVIAQNGNLLTYTNDDNQVVTHRILDDTTNYANFVVDSGATDWTSFTREALDIRWATHNDFLDGRRLFHSSFVDGTHSEHGNPVLTPVVGMARGLTVQTSCIACHVNNGRGIAPASGDLLQTMVVKVASGMPDGHGGNLPHPRFGNALQPTSLNAAVAREPATRVNYADVAGSYPDGHTYHLQRPGYSVSGTGGDVIFATSFEANEPAGQDVQYFSPRMPQTLVGLGLLEAVDEETLFALQDPDDENGDGISGRVSLVYDPSVSAPRVGRFGWKADKYSLRHFAASALRDDIGVKTSLFTQPDCGASETDCAQQALGAPTLSDNDLALLATYVEMIRAPSRRPDEIDTPGALAGEQLFASTGCGSCHVATLHTGMRHPLAELRGQDIHPYTDLLLHDMGADLADRLSASDSANREWRTPPLWGLGLAAPVNGHTRLLHDGRARNVEEAILWHGGEAGASVQSFKALSATQRSALLEFLESL